MIRCNGRGIVSCTHTHMRTHTGEQGECRALKQTQSYFLDNQCASASGEFDEVRFPRRCVAGLSFPYDGKKENIAQEQGKTTQTACWTSLRPLVNTAVVAVGGDLTQNVEGTARAHRWLDLLHTGYIDTLVAPPSRQRDPGWRVFEDHHSRLRTQQARSHARSTNARQFRRPLGVVWVHLHNVRRPPREHGDRRRPRTLSSRHDHSRGKACARLLSAM